MPVEYLDNSVLQQGKTSVGFERTLAVAVSNMSAVLVILTIDPHVTSGSNFHVCLPLIYEYRQFSHVYYDYYY